MAILSADARSDFEVARSGLETQANPEVRRVRIWARNPRLGSAEFQEKACRLPHDLDQIRYRLSRGRSGTPGRRDVRLIDDYLVPDLSVLPWRTHDPGAVASWVRSQHFTRMLRIVTGRDPLRLVPAGPYAALVEAHQRELARLSTLPQITDHDEHARVVEKLRQSLGQSGPGSPR